MGDEGFEQPSKNGTLLGVARESDAESGALGAREAPMDPDLALIVESWFGLSEPIKAAILAMIQASKNR